MYVHVTFFLRAKTTLLVDINYFTAIKVINFLIDLTNEKRADSSKEDCEKPQELKVSKRQTGPSFVWDHFKKCAGSQEAICNHCGSKIKTKGNTSNLIHHLQSMHKNYANKPISKPALPTNLDNYLNKVKCYENGSARKNAIDEAIMRMIAIDIQPFSVLEDKGFCELVHLLDPRYKIPSKKFFRNVLLENKYDDMKSLLKSMLQNVSHVALTTDCWTSKAVDGYITVTCHFINSRFELKSAVLATQKLLTPTNHTAKSMAETLQAVMTEWDVYKKVVCVVTDNDATIKKSCEILQLKNLPCCSHTLNLIVQEALKLPSLNDIFCKCKRIVAFFKSSTVANAKLKEAQNVKNPLGLVQEVATRWNSAFLMMDRIKLLSSFIGKVLLISRKAPNPLSVDEIGTISELIELLRPFNDATQQISANKIVTISLIIPIISELHQKINKLRNEIKSDNVLEALNMIAKRLPERFGQYEKRTIPRISTLIDARFKKYGFLHTFNADEAAKALEDELSDCLSLKTSQKPPTPPEPKRTRFEFLKFKIAAKPTSNRADSIIMLNQYLTKPNAEEDVDPLIYWKVIHFLLITHANINYFVFLEF